MKKEPEKIQKKVPSHVEYWKKRNLKKYRGGPFSDRSGGLITFEAENIEEATKIIMNDPFVLENLIGNKWIKEWIVKYKEKEEKNGHDGKNDGFHDGQNE